MNALFLWLLFSIIVSTILYLIITYVSLILLLLSALCFSSLLILTLPPSSLYSSLCYCLISTTSILVLVFCLVCFLHLVCFIYCSSTRSKEFSVIVWTSQYLIWFFYCSAASLVRFSSFWLVCHSAVHLEVFFVITWVCGMFSGLCVARLFVLCAFLGTCVVFIIGRNSTDVPSPHTPRIQLPI